MNFRKYKKGITLVETLMYAGVLLIVVVILVQIIFSILRIHRRTAVSQLIESSGGEALERMVREIRLATNIVDASSSFDSNPGRLFLEGVDEYGDTYSVEFSILNGILQISKNGGTAGNLTSEDVNITNLLFEKVVNDNSEAVKITFELESSKGLETKSIVLNNFVILRGSY